MNDLLEPAPRLRPFIEAYWQRRGMFEQPKKVRVLADACTKLIFEFAHTEWPSCYLLGTQLQPIVITLAGKVDRLGIRFRPGMAGFFIDRPLDGLAGRFSSIAYLSVPEAEQIRLRLASRRSFEERAAIVGEWLLVRLEQRRQRLPVMLETARLRHALRRGRSLEEVAAAFGWSERRLQRVCRERFGATAKALYRLYRFEALQARLRGSGTRLAALATELGFSDQAHMTREFRQFAGTSISSFLGERAAVGNLQDSEAWLPVLRQLEEEGLR